MLRGYKHLVHSNDIYNEISERNYIHRLGRSNPRRKKGKDKKFVVGTNLAYSRNGGKLVCLDLHCPTELSAITEISELSNMVAINHMCLLDTWNVTRVNEELSFKFYSSLMDLN